PIPQSLWSSRDEHGLWAVFKSHEEACAVLSLPPTLMNIAPALESDLEPFNKLTRFEFRLPLVSALCLYVTAVLKQSLNLKPANQLSQPGPLSSQMLHLQESHPQLSPTSHEDSSRGVSFTLSSNPPNPRSIFRLGDWICNSPKCAAHNFGRNHVCIGCGCSRTMNSPVSPSVSRPPLSPRFANAPNTNTPNFNSNSLSSMHTQQVYATAQSPSPAQPVNAPSVSQSKSGHPLLTPSGRSFAVGGRVQNVSVDPLAPCIMYWPENEPFPDPGQIRPNGLVGIPQPPILNTGNRGPIAHQPGDWICQKCNYLNWRRRKVCQTCFPYAEGNGDSISAAVQAERIALLTSVLTQTQTQAHSPSVSTAHHLALAPPVRNQVLRAHSVTPPQIRRPFVDVSPPPQSRVPNSVVHRSQSQVELGSQYMQSNQRIVPIYQTSGHHHQPQRRSSPQLQLHAPTPAPLLPSFLQDIVHSPTLSTSSTSSADISSGFDEFDDTSASPSRTSVTSRSRQTSVDS
ncbi:hypothetical protein EV360DRAFT_7163, partial [Lentinula raphanica]